MRLVQSKKISLREVIVLKLETGEDVLEAIETAVSDHGIEHAMILGGVGSASRYHVHVVKTTGIPPGNVFMKGEGPYDIVSMSGLVMDGRVHGHIMLTDETSATGGHLEPGCTVLTFCIVTLGVTDGDSLKDLDRYRPPAPGA